MQLTFGWFKVGVVLFSLPPPTLAFSRGASKSSCHEMIPGHIRAQTQDPEQSHIILRTSASSYLPGQLVTVTVRSSRDFMGFLLQARSVESTRTGAKDGKRSTSLGPVLVGGSWVLTPPGTHTLRCFTAGDTLTHSDKQLKRNLSFVWKAPDVPMGDIKFYVTVVQSYFVHWAGIESTMVRDGSRSPWSGGNNTGLDGGKSIFAEEDEVTDFPGFKGYQALNDQKGETTSASTTLRPPTTISSGRPNEIPQETFTEITQTVLVIQSQATITSPRVNHVTNLTVNQLRNENNTERNDPLTLDSLQNVRKDNITTSSRGVAEKAVATTNRGTQSYTSGEQLTEVTHPVSDREAPATLAYLGIENPTDQEGNEKKSNRTLDFFQNPSKGPDTGTSGVFSGVTEDISTDNRSPDATLGPSTVPKPTSSVLVVNFSATSGTPGLAPFDESNAPVSSGSLPDLGRDAPSGLPSRVTEEAGTETGSPVTQTVVLSDPLPLTTSLSSVDGKGMEGLSALLPYITRHYSSSPFPNASLAPVKDGDVERNETKLNNPILPTVPVTKDSAENPTITTTGMPSSIHRIYVTNPPRSTFQDPKGAIKDSSVQFEPQSSEYESQIGFNGNGTGSKAVPRPQKPFDQIQMSTTKPHLGSKSGIFSFTQESPNEAFSKTQTSLLKLVFPSESPTLQSSIQSNSTASVKLLPDNPLSVQEHHSTTSSPKLKPLTSFPQTLPQTITPQSEDEANSQSDPPQKVLSISATSWFKPHSLTGAPKVYSNGLRTTQSITTRSINPLTFPLRFHPTFSGGKGKEVQDLLSEAKIKTMSPIFASISPSSSSPVSVSTDLTADVTISSFGHPSSTTPLYQDNRSTQTFSTQTSTSPSPDTSNMKNGLKTAPALSALPSASPMPTPPNLPSVQPPSPSYELSNITSSTIPSPNYSHFASTSAPLTTSVVSPSTFNITSTFSVSSPPASPPPFSTISSSPLGSSSSYNSSQSTSPHSEPSPAPRRSPYNTTATASSRQQLTPGQKLLIQNHITSSAPEPNHNQPSARTVVHENPEPHPNLDQNIKPKLKPNLHNPKPSHPSNPSLTPGKDGKYPDIIPRHSAWELGMLLGCSAGLGMVLVVGVRYMYHQACGKRTEVTLNDREREYGRGERGLIHVQECGDLVRVRRIRDNSFVLLAEYDILASPGD